MGFLCLCSEKPWFICCAAKNLGLSAVQLKTRVYLLCSEKPGFICCAMKTQGSFAVQ
jgi:hypothetical protein